MSALSAKWSIKEGLCAYVCVWRFEKAYALLNFSLPTNWKISKQKTKFKLFRPFFFSLTHQKQTESPYRQSNTMVSTIFASVGYLLLTNSNHLVFNRMMKCREKKIKWKQNNVAKKRMEREYLWPKTTVLSSKFN